MYYRKIINYKKDTLYPIIETIVCKDAEVITDGYPSYEKLKEKLPAAWQRKSNTGKYFPILHQQVMNFKGSEVFITNAAINIVRDTWMNAVFVLTKETQNSISSENNAQNRVD